MDHKEQHHQHHEKERAERIKEEELHEAAEEKCMLPFHPAWFFVIGLLAVGIALTIWTLVS